MNDFYQHHLSHEEIPLSDTQLRAILGDPGKRIIAYHELENMYNLDDLMASSDSIVLLYESAYNTGHYVSVIRGIDGEGQRFVEVFDPYGDGIEASVSKYRYNRTNFLLRLISNTPSTYKIWNTIGFQKHRIQSQVCGRYACFRILHRDMPLKDFQKKLGGVRRHMEIDKFITLLTDLSVRYK